MANALVVNEYEIDNSVFDFNRCVTPSSETNTSTAGFTNNSHNNREFNSKRTTRRNEATLNSESSRSNGERNSRRSSSRLNGAFSSSTTTTLESRGMSLRRATSNHVGNNLIDNNNSILLFITC